MFAAGRLLDAISSNVHPPIALNHTKNLGFIVCSNSEPRLCDGSWAITEHITIHRIEGLEGHAFEVFSQCDTKKEARGAVAEDAIRTLMALTATTLRISLSLSQASPSDTSSSCSPSASFSSVGSLEDTSATSRDTLSIAECEKIKEVSPPLRKPSSPIFHRQIFENILQQWEVDRAPRLCAIDVEMTEKIVFVDDSDGRRRVQPSAVSQVGIAIDHAGVLVTAVNLMVTEWKYMINPYCPSDPDAFKFGCTIPVAAADLSTSVQWYVDQITSTPGSYFVGHTISNDRKWLEEVGVSFGQTPMCDIAEVQRAWRNTINKTSLQNMAKDYRAQVGVEYHNAGNDAYMTMVVTKNMAYEQRPWLMLA